jgi:hypothetical protein
MDVSVPASFNRRIDTLPDTPMSTPIISPNGAGALSQVACPADGHLVHAADQDVHVTPADGLAGLLGLVKVEANGTTTTMTAAELAAFRADQCSAPGGDAKVVRSDNHRELLRESVEHVGGKCVDERGLDQEARRLALPGGYGGLGGPDTKLRQDFDMRVALFGRTTVKLDGFKPPGWEAAGSNPAACYKLACAGAQATARAGETATGGGGVVLYEKTAQRIKTDKDASQLALAQVKAHIDAGRAVVAGVNEPGTASVVDAKKQPVTDHFVAVYGYEMDSQGKVVALLAKDNAVSGTAEVRFEVHADGSIGKPAEPKRAEEYLRQEYQLSEVRFSSAMPYTGTLSPTNDANQRMAW